MRIKKVSQPTPIIPDTAQISDSYSESTTDGYSCNYVNELTNLSKATLPVVSSSTVTYNNSFYIQLGDLVFVIVSDVLIPGAMNGSPDLLKGAPKPASDVAFQIFRQDGKIARLHVGTDGIIRGWYVSNLAGSSTYYWYGMICYTI